MSYEVRIYQNGNMKTMTSPSGKVITYNYANDQAVSVLNGAANLASNIAYKPSAACPPSPMAMAFPAR
jgi:hypothetical protein